MDGDTSAKPSILNRVLQSITACEIGRKPRWKVSQSAGVGDNPDGMYKYHSLPEWVMTSMEYKVPQSPGMSDNLDGIQSNTVSRDEW